eukprot:TRINITY_DN18897_c0_g2_i1.p2 TRINITY_DN18897_c0_g2~~TRINITY_DN18897_c0_g2_i1.p2  ORF type:complete len:604 (+),score=129.81 TRINITY_DN18897_c0_g2_i1:97-1812(+)
MPADGRAASAPRADSRSRQSEDADTVHRVGLHSRPTSFRSALQILRDPPVRPDNPAPLQKAKPNLFGPPPGLQPPPPAPEGPPAVAAGDVAFAIARAKRAASERTTRQAPILPADVAAPNQVPAAEDNVAPVRPREDEELIRDLESFLNNISPSTFALPMTKQAFIALGVNGTEVKDFDKHCPDIHNKVENLIKEYRGKIEDYYKTVQFMAKDLQTLQANNVPKTYNASSSVQYRKEVKEEFNTAQTVADKKKAKDDFLRRIASNKKWLADMTPKLEISKYAEHVLSEVYDMMTAAKQNYPHDTMQEIKAHIVYICSHQLSTARNRASKKFEDKAKELDDKEKEQKKKEEKSETLVKDYPLVAQALYFRELEDRLLAVIYAEKNKAEEAYMRARRGQELSRLERLAWQQREELAKKELPHLKHQASVFWKASKKGRQRSRTQSTSSKNKAGRGRSNSAKSNASARSNRSARSNGSAKNRSASANKAKVRTGTTPERSASASKKREGSSKKRTGNSTGSTRGRSSSRGRVDTKKKSKSTSRGKKGGKKKGKGKGGGKGKTGNRRASSRSSQK